MKKSRILLSSLLTIVLCFSLIAAATFALLTSTSKTNIAVTSGKVSIVATAKIDKAWSAEWDDSVNDYVRYNDLTRIDNGYEFTNKGTVVFEDNTLTVKNITLGDGFSLNIDIVNRSSVKTKYRVEVNTESDSDLLDLLTVSYKSADGKIDFKGQNPRFTDWMELEKAHDTQNGDKIDTLNVEIELPFTAGDDYQGKTGNFSITVFAEQGNGNTETPEEPPVTASTEIGEYADSNSWDGGSRYFVMQLGDVTLTTNKVNESGANGTYNTDEFSWDLYQSENATLTISVPNGYELQSFAITYTSDGNGVLKVETGALETYALRAISADYNVQSGVKYSVVDSNKSEITIVVSGDGDGKVQVTDIKVVYVDKNATECEHKWGVGEVTIEPTCTAEGVRVYTCSECGDTKTEALKKVAHTEEEIPATEPTCDTPGATAGTRCSVCGEILTQPEEIPAHHDWEDVTPTWEFDYSEKTATATFKCNKCDHTETVVDEDLEEVNKTEADCVNDKTFKYKASVEFESNTYEKTDDKLQTEEGSALGHDWTDVEPSWTFNYAEKKATAKFECGREHCEHYVEITDKLEEVEVTEADCVNDKTFKYKASVEFENNTYEKTDDQLQTEEGSALGHDWEGVEPSWTFDYAEKKATAKFECGRENCEHYVEVTDKLEEVEVTEADCEHDKTFKYKAEVSFNDEIYTVKSEVQTVEDSKLGHDWDTDNIEWNWSGHESATATLKCKNNNKHTLAGTVEMSVADDTATCEDEGYIRHTATATFEGVFGTYSDYKDETTGKLDHDWDTENIEWNWSGYESATATFHCSRCTETSVVTAKITFSDKAASCEEDGLRTYTATVEGPDGNTYTATAEETLGKLGHDWEDVTPTWEFDYSEKTAKATFKCNKCDHTETVVDEDLEEVNETEADCVNERTFYYKASVTFKGETYETTDDQLQTEEGSALGHDWTDVEPSWTFDYAEKKATAKFECGRENCVHYVEVTDEDLEEVEVTEADCEHDKTFKYKAEVSFNDNTYTVKSEVQTVKDSKLGHVFEDLKHSAEGHWYKCIRCEETTEPVEHFGGEATHFEKAECEICGEEYGEVIAHTFDQKNTDAKYHVSDATCEQRATYYYSCECGEVDPEGKTFETGELAAHKLTGHTAKKDATCTEAGNIEYWTCEVCDKNFNESDEEVEDITIEALDHEWAKDWTSDGNGKHYHECVRFKDCGKTSQPVDCNFGDDYTKVDDQLHSQKCEDCGYVEKSEHTLAYKNIGDDYNHRVYCTDECGYEVEQAHDYGSDDRHACICGDWCYKGTSGKFTIDPADYYTANEDITPSGDVTKKFSDEVTVVFVKGNNTGARWWLHGEKKELRMYNTSQLEIQASGIYKIEFTFCEGASYMSLAAGGGTLSSSTSSKTWTGDATDSVKFSFSNTAHITSITIYYESSTESHNWKPTGVTEAANCAHGTLTEMKCVRCGETYLEDDGLKTDNHIFTENSDTKYENGNQMHYTQCSVCGEYIDHETHYEVSDTDPEHHNMSCETCYWTGVDEHVYGNDNKCVCGADKPEEKHECEDACEECGGCLTDCKDPECAKKCECPATDPDEPKVVEVSLEFKAINRKESSTTEQVWKENGIVFTYSKGSYNSNLAEYDSPIRIYAGTISKVEFAGIKKIVYHANTSAYATVVETSLNNAKLSNATITLSNKDVMVEFAKTVDSVEFTASAQLRLDSLDIEAVVASGGGEVDPTPKHECGSACETCQKCTDKTCDNEVCKEKCPGHDSGVTPTEQNITYIFSEHFSADSTALTNVDIIKGSITYSVEKGTGSTAPKYYANGTSLRAYGGNTITIKSEYTITKIEFTFGGSDGSNTITANNGKFSTNTWTGSDKNIVFTIGGSSGHRRIASIKITYTT